jgi:hypothetical protein
MDVDEARRDRLPGAVDRAGRGEPAEILDRDDALAVDGDVRAPRGAAVADDHVSAAELQIAIHEVLLLAGRSLSEATRLPTGRADC